MASPLLYLPSRPCPKPVTPCTGEAPPSAAPPLLRRTANYQPSIWNDDFIQSLNSDDMDEADAARHEKLKEDVRRLVGADAGGLAAQLELVDALRRLGVAYHFEEPIELMLHARSRDAEKAWAELEGDLCHTALLFRLLREHGLEVSQDVFNNFRDVIGSFGETLTEDAEGMLSLYEASFLAFEGEATLDEARAFTASHLRELLLKGDADPGLRERVASALEMPLHWRMPRLYARWFIDVYERDPNVNPALLRFAKLDFNRVQTIHRRDMKEMSRWWKDFGYQEHLSFARDRILEIFLWTVGLLFEPQFMHCRRVLAQVGSVITVIDDVYDVYGSLDELELFNDAVERWDISAVEQLPDYMKICFLGLFNMTNELAYTCFKENGYICVTHLQKSWVNLCKCYLLEARWYHSNYTPTFEEYMNNAWISIATPILLTHAYFFLGQNITKEAVDSVENYANIIQWSSVINRLADDLGTSRAELERGDVPKSIQCYMHQTDVSEEAAREHMKYLIGDAWMKMNKDCSLSNHFPRSFVKAAINFARTSQCVYQYGDGVGVPDKESKGRIKSLFVEPINEIY